MNESNLLSEVDKQLVTDLWANGENDYWLQVFENEIAWHIKTGKPFDLSHLAVGLSAITQLCIKTLDFLCDGCCGFETTSDCLHGKDDILFSAAPELGRAIIDVLYSCFFIAEEQEHYDPTPIDLEAINNELLLLPQKIQAANIKTAQRYFIEDKLARSAKETREKIDRKKEVMAEKMAIARAEKPPKYDWDAIRKKELDLCRSGRSHREWANIIKKQFGISPDAYRNGSTLYKEEKEKSTKKKNK